jgi:chromosome segregation ATPase
MAINDSSMMKQKMKMIEGDRKVFYEQSQTTIKQNKDLLKTLQKENKELKLSLATLTKSIGGMNDQAIQDNEISRLDERIVQLKRKYDVSKSEVEYKQSELKRLKEKLGDIEKESQPILTDESPLTRKIRMLENRLDKSMIKYNEAMSIRKTYEQIVKRLKEERIGFDNQLAAIERTLKAKEHDYQELLNMSHDANHAKEIAKAELAQFRAAYEEERRQKDKELTERYRLTFHIPEIFAISCNFI